MCPVQELLAQTLYFDESLKHGILHTFTITTPNNFIYGSKLSHCNLGHKILHQIIQENPSGTLTSLLVLVHIFTIYRYSQTCLIRTYIIRICE